MESLCDRFVRKYVRKINPVWFLKYRWRKSYTDKGLDDFINEYYTEEDCDKKSLKKTMKQYWICRGVHHSDFYEMSLEKKNANNRKDFVPRWEEVDLYYQVNNQRYIDVLRNKGNCFEIFKDFYKRRIVSMFDKDVVERNIKKDVVDFINGHDEFIIKPIRLQGGEGIRVIDKKQEPMDTERFLLEYMNKPEYSRGFVLEELIVQDVRLAALHPASVNTIRITTVNYGDSIETKWPVLRMGRGGSIVDSTTIGGIFAAIDIKTGITFRATDKQRGSSYSVHPDTQMPLIGFQIPKWEELLETIKTMASKCPDCRIMGWDMALTDNGWVVVECNFGPELLIQWAKDSGVRNEFEIVKKRLHAKKGKSYLNKTLEQYLSVPLNP